MVHVAAVSDLMRHQPVQEMRRSKDDPPAVPDGAACGTTSPAARGVPDRNGPDRHAGTACRFGRRSAKPAPRQVPKISFDPSRECIAGSAAAQHPAGQLRSSGQIWIPVQPHGTPFDRDDAFWSERLGRLDRRQLFLDPIGLLARPNRARLAGSFFWDRSAAGARGPHRAGGGPSVLADGGEARPARRGRASSSIPIPC